MANSDFFVRHGINVNGQSNVESSNGHITVGNSTVNTSISSTGIRTGNTTINVAFTGNTITVGALVINSTALGVGNSTVNSSINSTSIAFNGSVGSNGQYLQSNGTVTTWGSAPTTGGLALIQSITISNNVVSAESTTAFSNTYDDYVIVIENLKSAVNSTYNPLIMQVANSTGGYLTNAADYYQIFATGVYLGTAGDLSANAGANVGLSSVLFIQNINSANSPKPTKVSSFYIYQSSFSMEKFYRFQSISGASGNACIIRQARFFISSGGGVGTPGSGANLGSGVIRFYGVTKT